MEATCTAEAVNKMTGSGSIQKVSSTTYSPGDANCSGASPVVTDCELPWNGSIEVDVLGPDTVGVQMEVCLRVTELGIPCEGDIGFSIANTASQPEDYKMGIGNPFGPCEVIATLEAESTNTTYGDPHYNQMN